MSKVKNTIPVLDICALADKGPINDQVIAQPFAAYLKVHPNLHLPHRHSFYHLVFFTSGAGYHTIDFEKFPVLPGQIYFMVPGQVHSWNFEGKVDGYVVNFSASLFHSFLANDLYLGSFPFLQGNAAESVINLKGEPLSAARQLLEKIVGEVSANKPQVLDMIRVYLLQLFMSVGRASSHVEGAVGMRQGTALLQSFRRLIEERYAQMRLPKEYASLLCITPNHLNALCQQQLSRSAGELIRERVLLEAKRLLVNVDISISEVAGRLDFADGSHFTKFFKKYVGCTPEEFRKNTLSGYKS